MTDETTTAPGTDASGTDAPRTEAPGTDAPGTDADDRGVPAPGPVGTVVLPPTPATVPDEPPPWTAGVPVGPTDRTMTGLDTSVWPAVMPLAVLKPMVILRSEREMSPVTVVAVLLAACQ